MRAARLRVYYGGKNGVVSKHLTFSHSKTTPNLRDPGVIAAVIVEDLKPPLKQFPAVANDLKRRPD